MNEEKYTRSFTNDITFLLWWLAIIIGMVIFTIGSTTNNITQEIDDVGREVHGVNYDVILLRSELETHDTTQAKEIQELKKLIKEKKR